MLTKKDRASLLRVKELILERKSSFICLALDRVSIDSPELSKSCGRLRRYVRLALGNASTLQTWQKDNGIPARTREQRRNDRMDWIDWLLEGG